ncbi:MAG: TIGR03546 family protein [Elusimicrobia bacterium]|nr:TIGR03546 family protein [Elusimicrobiota bacterium]
MNPLSIIRQFIKGLTAETDPRQIGGGIALGFLIGLLPKANLTAQLLLVLLMALRVNLPMALMTMLAMTFINPLVDKLTDPIGYYLLSSQALYPLWTKLYNMPILPWTGFNNTVLLGGLVFGLVFMFPVYLAGKKFGVYYNETFKEKIMSSKTVKAMKASWLLDWYFKVSV